MSSQKPRRMFSVLSKPALKPCTGLNAPKRVFASGAILVFSVLALLLSQPLRISALELSQGLVHYAQEMEYYYQHPKPERLAVIFRGLGNSGAFKHAEKRLLAAAFLAEAAKAPEVLRSLLPLAQSAESRQSLAWAVHLAQDPEEKSLLDQLLGQTPTILRRQIESSPGNLNAWPLEPSVIQMHWAAFLASGKKSSLDGLLASAKNYARAKASGRVQENSAGQAAAASLYEFAPRHPRVREYLKEALATASPEEAALIRTILDARGGKP